jgi:hypothetical protein
MPVKPFVVRFLLTWLSCACLWLSSGSCIEQAVSRARAETIPARNVVTLRECVGQTVTVRGRVATTGQSRSGHNFLNFDGSELTAVCYPEHVANFEAGTPAKLYLEKSVELTGKIQLYRGKLQIRLAEPAQIRVVEAGPKSGAQGVQLRKIGEATWLSPAGLRYRGRDPAGLTRVEHIERHVRDQPSRAGPHGVFDGGSEVAFAVIDEAWRLAQRRKLRPRREGDRSSYTVSMGRRVGYLGGRTGAARGNPPLTRVFIVFASDTKDIITAYPK